jgi:hypothetical protein
MKKLLPVLLIPFLVPVAIYAEDFKDIQPEIGSNTVNSSKVEIEKNSKCDMTPMLKKLNDIFELEYSKNYPKELNEIYVNLTPVEKRCLIEIVEKTYPEGDSFYIVMLFSLFNDKSLLPLMQKFYLRQKTDYYKAQCEVYFFCVGYEKEKYLKRYIDRLDNSKGPFEELVYVALPCREKRVAKALLKYVADGKWGDGSAAERWVGTMSWIERNEKWLGNDDYQYLHERLNEAGYTEIRR